MVVFAVSVLAALAISFLCSLLEAAVLSFTPSQVAELAQRRPRLGAVWQGFKAHIERPIAVILVLNTAAHTVGATVAGAKFEELFGSAGLVWFSLLFTYLMLQFTEILPKSLGVHYNARLAPVVAYPLVFLGKALAPVLFLVHLVNRPFERRRARGQAPRTLEEIAALAGLARLSNQINPHQERIIKGSFRLSELRVAQVMIPAEQVSFLAADQGLLDALVAAHRDAHTRYPVCERGDRDRVLGYVNFKEMVYHLRTNPTDPSLRGIVRPVTFVEPGQSAARLLQVFVDQHEHVAIVRDDRGTTLGLVTLEDLIEELVGELEDEFDRLPRMVHPLRGGVWMAGGGVPVKELARRLGLELRGAEGTVSAWLAARLGRAPRPGDVWREAGAEFTVRRTRRGKVFEASARAARGGA